MVERSIPNITLDKEQLLSLVRPAFPSCNELNEFRVLSGGALNTIYKFGIKSREFIIRIYAKDRANCEIEKAIHQLIDKGVSTPKLIYANGTHEPWAYSIFEYISGIHISEVSSQNKTALSHKLGAALASIHQFKFPNAGFFGEGLTIKHPFKTGSSPYYEETLSLLSNGKNAKSRLGKKLTEQALSFIQEYKDFFPTIRKDEICLVHSDFKPVNLLYQQTGNIFVIDWEFAHAGNQILDFAILLRHRNEFPLDLDALVSGYTNSGGKLPDKWLQSALITDFVNMITLMETPPERPVLFQEFKKIIKSAITQRSSL